MPDPVLRGGKRLFVLDDAKQIEKVDKAGMLAGLTQYAEQMDDAWKLGEGLAKATGIKSSTGIVFAGMGGSGVGADLACALFRDSLKIPMGAAKDYTLPAWAGKGTLVVCTSYSGETEETLSCFVEAVRRGCSVLTVSGGGGLEKFAKLAGAKHVRVPTGLQPRAALAYLAVPLLRLLHESGHAKGELDFAAAVARASSTVKSCEPSMDQDENPAKQLAAFINNRVAVVYANGYLEPVARRWKTQLNENGKALAFCDVIPESNHNDLVAWSGGDRGIAARTCGLFLRHAEESAVVKARFEFVQSVVGQQTEAKVFEAEGATPLERMVHLLVLGDFASCYLAVLRGVDPTPVEVIKSLKAEVGKHKMANHLDTELRALLRKQG